MISHHPALFGGHRCCDNGDIMFLIVEGQDSTCSGLDPPLMYISKAQSMKVHGMSY